MLSPNLTLQANDGDSVIFNLVSQGLKETQRINTATVRPEGEYLNVKHSTTGKNGTAVERHLIQIQKSILVAGVPHLVTTNVTIAVDQIVPSSDLIVIDQLSELFTLLIPGFEPAISFTDVGVVQALLRGEG